MFLPAIGWLSLQAFLSLGKTKHMYKIFILSGAILMGGYAALKATHNKPVTPAAVNNNIPVHLPGSPLDFASWKLLPAASEIQWKASYITGGGHHGTLQLKEGALQTGSLNLVTSGRFVIDMNSIRATDLADAGERTSLEEHLKSADFFATSQFPTAYFTVTGSSQYVPAMVKGKLAIKGVVQPVEIPFVWRVQNDTLYMQAQISVDRTQWGISYQSEGLLNAVKNGIIANKVDLILQLRFYKSKDDNC